MSSVTEPRMQADFPQNSSLAIKKERFLSQEAPKFIDSAKKVARSILNKDSVETSYSSSCSSNVVDVHHHHYHDYGYGYGYNPFWARPVYVVDTSSNYRDESDRVFRAFVGVVFTVIAGAAFYTMGAILGRWNETSDEMDKTIRFKDSVRIYSHLSTESEQKDFDKLKRVATLKARIFKRMRHETVWNLAMAVSFAVAGTFAVIGALAGSYAFMTAGTVIALGAGAVALFRLGFDATQQRQLRDAKQILALASQ